MIGPKTTAPRMMPMLIYIGSPIASGTAFTRGGMMAPRLSMATPKKAMPRQAARLTFSVEYPLDISFGLEVEILVLCLV